MPGRCPCGPSKKCAIHDGFEYPFPPFIETRTKNCLAFGNTAIIEVLPSGGGVKKSPHPQESTSERERQARQLMREVKVYRRLPSHERLLKMISFSDDKINSYIIFEYMPRGNLEVHLASTAKITPEQQLQWCIQATEGVAFLHDFGVIHGDIKPQNMLLDSEMSIRIIDFSGSSIDGLRPLGVESTRYFLPRPLNSDMPCNIHTDLFALGSSLYHIMRRNPPYDHLKDHEVDEHFKRKQFPELRGVACGEIISSCWREKLSSANAALSLLHVQQRPVNTFTPFLFMSYRLFFTLRSWLHRGVAWARLFREEWF